METRKLKKTGFRITFEDGETMTKYLQAISPCFCNRDIKEDELEEIIIELRKKSGRYEVSNFLNKIRKTGLIEINKKYKPSDDKKTRLYIKENVYYAKWGSEFYPIVGDFKKYTGSESPKKYISKIDGVFKKSILKEKIKESDCNYKTFADHLNCTFTTNSINTCIRKIHFIAQTFHETNGFIDSSEKGQGKKSYGGGTCFKGRGLIHITHDYNYLPYYDEALNTGTYKDSSTETNKKYLDLYDGKNKIGEDVTEFIERKEKEKKAHGFPDGFIKDHLKPFAKVLASDLQHACYSAGFFWYLNDINDEADSDNSDGVSNIINAGDQLSKRKQYVKYLKEIFDYETCKKNPKKNKK